MLAVVDALTKAIVVISTAVAIIVALYTIPFIRSVQQHQQEERQDAP